MRRFFTAVVLLVSFSALAQNGLSAYDEKDGLQLHIVGTTGLADVVQLVSRQSPYHLGLGGLLEYKPWKTVGLGIGAEWAADIGYRAYEDVVGNSLYATYLPLYANVLVDFVGDKNCSFFSDTRLGYALPLKNKDISGFVEIIEGSYTVSGLYASTGIGFAFGRSLLSMGVELKTYQQRVSQADWDDWEREVLEDRFAGDNMLTFNGYLRYSYVIGGRHDASPSDWSAAHARESVASEDRYALYLYGGMGTLDLVWDAFTLIKLGKLIPMHYHVGAMFDTKLPYGWSLGVGTELHGSFGLHSVMGAYDAIGLSTKRRAFLSLPVYGNMKWCYEFDNIAPFVEFRLGYAFPLNAVHVQDFWIQYAEEPDPMGIYGDVRAQGVFTGMGVGIEAFGHSLSIGMTAMNVIGNLIDDYTPEEPIRIGSRMTNFYIRYAYALKLGK